MKFLSLISLAFAVAVSAATARTPLQEDATIENGLVMVAIGKMMRDECSDISPRYISAFTFAKSLESRARKLGYSRDEIDAYLKSREDKARVKAKARDWIAARGGDLCAVGRAEISAGTALGSLLKLN